MTKTELARRFDSFVERQANGCWSWTGFLDPKGYGRFSISGTGYRAHRVALEFAGRPAPTKAHFACHTCDNPSCVNPEHLWWGTPAENSHDAVKKGRLRRGSQHGRAKLDEASVRLIKQALADGDSSQRKIANRFGVDHKVVNKIAAGRIWTHV